MADDFIRIRSISELHGGLGFDKPKHPLISVIDVKDLDHTKVAPGTKYSADLYYIGMKSGDCGMRYGRHHYDFTEGVLAFMAPGQVVTATGMGDFDEDYGFMLYFHSDLIRATPLGENIDSYSFFSYDTHEALHLSDAEKQTMADMVKLIKDEYNQRIDNMSQRVIVSSLELLLNYCLRFYERQFNTRTASNKDVISEVEHQLKDYYKSGQLPEYGPPSIHFLAEKVNLSPAYLSDLLKKETGRSAKDHINDFLVDKAKTLLLSTEDTVSEIAYSLGFNYPHYFSRLFKQKTGTTPQKFRTQTN